MTYEPTVLSGPTKAQKARAKARETKAENIRKTMRLLKMFQKMYSLWTGGDTYIPTPEDIKVAGMLARLVDEKVLEKKMRVFFNNLEELLADGGQVSFAYFAAIANSL